MEKAFGRARRGGFGKGGRRPQEKSENNGWNFQRPPAHEGNLEVRLL